MITFAPFVLGIASLVSVIPGSFLLTPPRHTAPAIASEQATIPITEDALRQVMTGLPIASIAVHKAANETGTVILLPQSHRFPGSAISDVRNDKPALVQQDIERIASHIVHTYQVPLALTEGDMRGKVPEEKIDIVKKKIVLRDQFTAAQKELALSEHEKKSADRLLANMNRDIYLRGALHVVRATGAPIALYGTENQNTRDQSATIVRDYLYVEDRLYQLTSSQTLPTSIDNKNNSISLPNKQAAIIKKLLKQRQNHSLGQSAQIISPLDKTTQIPEGNAVLTDIYRQFVSLKEPTAANSLNAPARKDNPYKQETSIQVLEKRKRAIEQQIDTVVIRERNKDTAENTVAALSAERANIALLQYGAGHTSGLVNALTDRGLTVIVLTPHGVTVQ